MNNSDLPAMPLSNEMSSDLDSAVGSPGKYGLPTAMGLTKREYFAGLAMQNIINRYNPWDQGDFDSSEYEIVAENAVGLADALLKELAK